MNKFKTRVAFYPIDREGNLSSEGVLHRNFSCDKTFKTLEEANEFLDAHVEENKERADVFSKHDKLSQDIHYEPMFGIYCEDTKQWTQKSNYWHPGLEANLLASTRFNL